MAKHVYRDKDFRFVYVHVWNNISENISNDVSFPSFKQSLKLFILSEDFKSKYDTIIIFTIETLLFTL